MRSVTFNGGGSSRSVSFSGGNNGSAIKTIPVPTHQTSLLAHPNLTVIYEGEDPIFKANTEQRLDVLENENDNDVKTLNTNW